MIRRFSNECQSGEVEDVCHTLDVVMPSMGAVEAASGRRSVSEKGSKDRGILF